MAAENICNVLYCHLNGLDRPQYLQKEADDVVKVDQKGKQKGKRKRKKKKNNEDSDSDSGEETIAERKQRKNQI